ncbi:MAG: hypothetical protein LAP38_09295 [Acidobacteriia bacterium]|nr:hypothetical protein [Terriglobia bacterium]
MKKLMTLMLGLSLVMGSTALFANGKGAAQEEKKEKKAKKKGKKKKGDKKDEEKKG